MRAKSGRRSRRWRDVGRTQIWREPQSEVSRYRTVPGGGRATADTRPAYPHSGRIALRRHPDYADDLTTILRVVDAVAIFHLSISDGNHPRPSTPARHRDQPDGPCGKHQRQHGPVDRLLRQALAHRRREADPDAPAADEVQPPPCAGAEPGLWSQAAYARTCAPPTAWRVEGTSESHCEYLSCGHHRLPAHGYVDVALTAHPTPSGEWLGPA
jgi:hypothetical protein